jgi:PhzF family phenazine biosynthesis protein
MQAVAAEMNLSETAFLGPRDAGFELRWFTPSVEVDLCGHATLASAHILWETGRLQPQAKAEFYTKSGTLGGARKDEWIELDFPAEPPEQSDSSALVLDALGIARARYFGANRFDYLCELDSEEVVRGLRPDFLRLGELGCRGVIVTAPSSSAEFDFVSRFFAPACGINEDPVTGSAHCCLGPYWSPRLGKKDMIAFQASARGGIVKVGVRDDRVLLGGQAVTVLRAELLG